MWGFSVSKTKHIKKLVYPRKTEKIYKFTAWDTFIGD